MTDTLAPVDEIRERHEYHDAGLDEGTQFSHKIALEVHKDRADLLRHIDALEKQMQWQPLPTPPTEDAVEERKPVLDAANSIQWKDGETSRMIGDTLYYRNYDAYVG